MTDAAPALPDAELRETLDLLSTVVASVSDRVDNQGNAIDKLTKTAAATRQAAFAAQKQTDPERYGEIIAGTVDGQTRDALQQRVATIGELLSRERHGAQKVFNPDCPLRLLFLLVLFRRGQFSDIGCDGSCLYSLADIPQVEGHFLYASTNLGHDQAFRFRCAVDLGPRVLPSAAGLTQLSA